MQAVPQHAMNTVEATFAPGMVHTALSMYRTEQVMNLSSVEVINRLYGVAIHAIKKDDRQLAVRAINELIAALNFEYKDVAVSLYKLYQYAKHCLRKGKTAEAIEVMEELRGAWREAFKL